MEVKITKTRDRYSFRGKNKSKMEIQTKPISIFYLIIYCLLKN